MDATGLVLVCGIPSEAPVSLVTDALEELGCPFAIFNQRTFADADLDFEISEGAPIGELRIGRQTISLEQVCGVYARLMDDRQLSEYRALAENDPRRRHCRALHDALFQWIELTPARVVNRAAAMGSNASKPYQAQLIARHGFDVPDTIVTNDPSEVLAFRARHGRVIYKSASSVRSIVRELKDDDLDRLAQVRWCATQFQALVEGVDVRVHVVGNDVFATAIETDATDYRYAAREGGRTTLRPRLLDDTVRERCVALARGLGLAFAGIDLRETPNGRWVCFEVNPSPGFSFYEHATGQPIADAVARYLSRGSSADSDSPTSSVAADEWALSASAPTSMLTSRAE